MTKIEWTDATWNPLAGCSVVSPGCTNCYAMRMAGTRLKDTPKYKGLTQDSKAGPVWTGEVRFDEASLTLPLKWGKPRMVFVNSMSDLFHEDVLDDVIDRIFAVMALTRRHQYQILTKRPERMREYVSRLARSVEPLEVCARDLGYTVFWQGQPLLPWPIPNIWLGTSVEDQTRADERIPLLLATPAAIRFLSIEPLLGPVDLIRWRRCPRGGPDSCGNKGRTCAQCDPRRTSNNALDWVIVGGESGPGARPMHPDWARSIRDQCVSAGVPFFMKQMDKKTPIPADLLIREYPDATR